MGMPHKHPKSKRGGARVAKTTERLPIFRRLFAARFDAHKLNQIGRTHQRRRRRPLLPFADLLLALVYHVLLGAGALQDHVEELTGVRLSGSALAQRRQRLNWKIFQEILALVAPTLDRIVAAVTPERRARSCPRAVRQPVGSWPRLLRRQEWQGAIQYEILPVSQ